MAEGYITRKIETDPIPEIKEVNFRPYLTKIKEFNYFICDNGDVIITGNRQIGQSETTGKLIHFINATKEFNIVDIYTSQRGYSQFMQIGNKIFCGPPITNFYLYQTYAATIVYDLDTKTYETIGEGTYNWCHWYVTPYELLVFDYTGNQTPFVYNLSNNTILKSTGNTQTRNLDTQFNLYSTSLNDGNMYLGSLSGLVLSKYDYATKAMIDINTTTKYQQFFLGPNNKILFSTNSLTMPGIYEIDNETVTQIHSVGSNWFVASNMAATNRYVWLTTNNILLLGNGTGDYGLTIYDGATFNKVITTNAGAFGRVVETSNAVLFSNTSSTNAGAWRYDKSTGIITKPTEIAYGHFTYYLMIDENKFAFASSAGGSLSSAVYDDTTQTFSTTGTGYNLRYNYKIVRINEDYVVWYGNTNYCALYRISTDSWNGIASSREVREIQILDNGILSTLNDVGGYVNTPNVLAYFNDFTTGQTSIGGSTYYNQANMFRYNNKSYIYGATTTSGVLFEFDNITKEIVGPILEVMGNAGTSRLFYNRFISGSSNNTFDLLTKEVVNIPSLINEQKNYLFGKNAVVKIENNDYKIKNLKGYYHVANFNTINNKVIVVSDSGHILYEE